MQQGFLLDILATAPVLLQGCKSCTVIPQAVCVCVWEGGVTSASSFACMLDAAQSATVCAHQPRSGTESMPAQPSLRFDTHQHESDGRLATQEGAINVCSRASSPSAHCKSSHQEHATSRYAEGMVVAMVCTRRAHVVHGLTARAITCSRPGVSCSSGKNKHRGVAATLPLETLGPRKLPQPPLPPATVLVQRLLACLLLCVWPVYVVPVHSKVLRYMTESLSTTAACPLIGPP